MTQLNCEQKAALDIISSGHNLLVLGAAGTGKSFLVKEIVRSCKNLNKTVALTCTTGISCAIYKDAKTIHQWSGIDDGRFSASEIKDVLKNNPKHSKTVESIRNTHVLIIDECSMLSKKMFDSLAQVCSIKCEDLLFGGIQLILVGDFQQLPPVPNPLCNDEGDFCFNSTIFDQVIKHRAMLTAVIRQKEETLITAIRQVAAGKVSDQTKTFLETLSRPLCDGDSVKLFATNDRVDDYNRARVVDFHGQTYEFIATDSGEKKYLSHILAPRILWLKIGAPVILLRNLSEKLFNGLRGEVIDIKDGIPIIHFLSVGLKIPIHKVKFTVFSCRQNRDIAVREQLPLKLAFALTVHKAQGMTLDRVEVDCSGMFKPGQLGVAIGRAKSIEGLRVLNFSLKACMAQPAVIKMFLEKTGMETLSDRSCCLVSVRPEPNPSIFLVNEPVQCGVSTDVDLEFDSDFDKDFDEVMKTIETDESNTELPPDLNLNRILDNLKTEEKDVVTPFQHNTNRIIKELDMSKFQVFCKKEYKKISEFLQKLKFEGPVSSQSLGEFYTRMHEYHISAEFLLSSMMLFEDKSFTEEMKSLSWNISIEIRKYILSRKADTYSPSSLPVTQRVVSNASKARIRYIGGYCIAKLSAKILKRKQSLRYTKSVEQQKEYNESIFMSHILDSCKEDEMYISSNTSHSESLVDITRRQFMNRGLTNISDNLFEFFIKLSSESLSLLNDKTFHKFGSDMFTRVQNHIEGKVELFQLFSDILQKQYSEKTETGVSEDFQPEDIIKLIYTKIVKTFLMVLFGQFRKDILDAFQVSKKMAHRKQIQVSTAGKKKGKRKADTRVVTQNPLKQKKISRKQTTSTLTSIDITSESETEPASPETKDSGRTHEHDIISDSGQGQSIQSQASTSQTKESEALCNGCKKEDTDTEWIQCGGCANWYHRCCAGLKHHMRWKKYSKKNAIFHCHECIS